MDLLDQIAVERAKLVQEGKLKKQKPLPPIKPEDEPFQIPDSWEWSRANYVTIVNPSVAADDEDTVAFLPMAYIEDGYSGRLNPSFCKWKNVKKGFSRFSDGDVIVAKISPCFENRKSAVFSKLGSEVGAGTTELHVLRPLPSLLSDYLLYLFKSEYAISALTPLMTGTAGQKRVPLAAISSLSLPIPSLAEQQRIVAKLEKILPLTNQLATLNRDDA